MAWPDAARMLARHTLIRLLAGPVAAHNRRRRHRSMRTVQRILVVRPDHLGDLLFATPALDMVRQAYPNAHITGLVGPWGASMWASNPNLDAIETLPFPGMTFATMAGVLAPYRLLVRSARQVAEGQFDLGILLRSDHWWGAALLWAVGVTARWGYDRPGMCPWLTGCVPYKPGRHEVEQDIGLVSAIIARTARLGARQPAPIQVDRGKGRPTLRPPDPVAPPTDLLAGWMGSQRRAVIHPGTAAANKLWTIDGWAQVARRLVGDGWAVAITGSPDEQALATRIFGALGETGAIWNLAGQTRNLGELAWILAQAGMVLGVDNGPLHIADALGRRTLHLYGPSDERVWGPWGDPALHRAFRAPGTRPGALLEVGSPALEGGPEMRAITVEMVMGEIDKLVCEA